MRFPLSGHARDFHPLDYAHVGRTKKKKQLSFWLNCLIIKVDQIGLEPMTSRLWVCCSNQLSYKSDIHLVKITIVMIADAKVRLFLEPCKFFIILFCFSVVLWPYFDGADLWGWGSEWVECVPGPWVLTVGEMGRIVLTEGALNGYFLGYGPMCMCNNYESISCFSISPHRYGHMCMCNS